jgi:hypothetical protein
MSSPPASPVEASSSEENLVSLDGEILREEDVNKVVERIYQLLIRQLRLDNEREGRIR